MLAVMDTQKRTVTFDDKHGSKITLPLTDLMRVATNVMTYSIAVSAAQDPLDIVAKSVIK